MRKAPATETPNPSPKASQTTIQTVEEKEEEEEEAFMNSLFAEMPVIPPAASSVSSPSLSSSELSSVRCPSVQLSAGLQIRIQNIILGARQ